jgi:hypothetical protein
LIANSKKVKKTKNDAQKNPSSTARWHAPSFSDGEGNGKNMADRKTLREKVFPKNPRFSRGKRAFASAALTKTLEISLVMFWKKSPTREKHRENGPFRHPPFSAAAKKVGQVS